MLYNNHKLLVLVLVGTLAACGGAVAPVVNKLTLTTSEPQNGARYVAANQIISLTLLEDLQASSVNLKTVHLIPDITDDVTHTIDVAIEDDEAEMEVVSVLASYDARTRQIYIVPQMSLNRGMRYRVHLSGVRLKSGAVIATGADAVELTFTVAHIHEIERVTYRQETGLPDSFESITVSFDNKREKVEYFNADDNGIRAELPDRVRFCDATLTTGEDVSWYETDRVGDIKKYEKKFLHQTNVIYGPTIFWTSTATPM